LTKNEYEDGLLCKRPVGKEPGTISIASYDFR